MLVHFRRYYQIDFPARIDIGTRREKCPAMDVSNTTIRPTNNFPSTSGIAVAKIALHEFNYEN